MAKDRRTLNDRCEFFVERSLTGDWHWRLLVDGEVSSEGVTRADVEAIQEAVSAYDRWFDAEASR
jgi:hypothetical protein